MKIALSAESTVDLTKTLLAEWNVLTTPFYISFGNKEYKDGELTNEEIFDLVKKTGVLPKTSAVSVYMFNEHFTKIFNDGYDAIIHISLSSEISSAYSNAVQAAKEFKNVYVVDSRSLSTGIALLCHQARLLIDQGTEPEEIKKLVEENTPNVQASFILYTLDYLYKGGRCSLLSLFGANLLHIRPQILVKDGKMGPSRNFMGEYAKCVQKYAEATLERFNNPDKSLAFVTYSSCNREIIDACKKALLDKGFERVEETISGSTITSHCGHNCIGILYINKN